MPISARPASERLARNSAQSRVSMNRAMATDRWIKRASPLRQCRSCRLLPACGACGRAQRVQLAKGQAMRSEEHTSELQSLMRISYAVFCLKKKTINISYMHLSITYLTQNEIT